MKQGLRFRVVLKYQDINYRLILHGAWYKNRQACSRVLWKKTKTKSIFLLITEETANSIKTMRHTKTYMD